MSTYEPGTVAVATVRGEPNVRVMRRALDWAHDSTKTGYSCSNDTHVTDIRPLVVLDPEDLPWEDVADMRAYATRLVSAPHLHIAGASLVSAVADQIEAQTKPPRIPEPGVWGVVEAALSPSGERLFFLRTAKQGDHDWQVTEDGSLAKWSELIDPVLIREGVTE